jgi:hypothetical protein
MEKAFQEWGGGGGTFEHVQYKYNPHSQSQFGDSVLYGHTDVCANKRKIGLPSNGDVFCIAFSMVFVEVKDIVQPKKRGV